MARHARRRRQRRVLPLFLATTGLVLVGWWVFPRSNEPGVDVPVNRPLPPILTSSRPDVTTNPADHSDVPERGDHPQSNRVSDAGPAVITAPGSDVSHRVDAIIEAGKKALAADDLIAARSHFSEALSACSDPTQRTALRAELTRIGNETIFSPRILPGDPHTERYVIQTGDSLGKIAKAYKISDDLLARINNLRNKNLIRAGQAIKVVKGPFRVVVDSSDYTMGVYLGDTFVRQFPVGLGSDASTPHGEWEVSTKLMNPTYYPPRGGQIVAADDPENPLGERWIGLHGIAGEAVGQLRYGIHGTNEPDSIGKSVSLGCIRMHNEDVEVVYDCLVEKYSTVVVR